ncbi:MAG TPA: hypothetical protein VF192_01115 [Longimicrobiales bacterium]
MSCSREAPCERPECADCAEGLSPRGALPEDGATDGLMGYDEDHARRHREAAARLDVQKDAQGANAEEPLAKFQRLWPKS